MRESSTCLLLRVVNAVPLFNQQLTSRQTTEVSLLLLRAMALAMFAAFRQPTATTLFRSAQTMQRAGEQRIQTLVMV
jgi:hypothetical protein